MDRQQLLAEIPHKEKEGIFVVTAPTAISANKIVVKILENYCDSKTALFLSGGRTPKKLYEQIAAEKTLRIGAALQIDERFGEKFHKKSNELMFKDTGLLEYFENQNIRFYPILEQANKQGQSMYSTLVYYTENNSSSESGRNSNLISIEQTTKDYDETLRFLLKYFPKTVGLLGLGDDGHSAGIPAIPSISKQILEDQSSLVTYYDEGKIGKYGARITMTYLALSQLNLIIILVLGQEKREALKLMFGPSASVRQAQDKGSRQAGIEKVPSRFYLKPEIAAKTILITDQIV